jgi:hypothetical protein
MGLVTSVIASEAKQSPDEGIAAATFGSLTMTGLISLDIKPFLGQYSIVQK